MTAHQRVMQTADVMKQWWNPCVVEAWMDWVARGCPE